MTTEQDILTAMEADYASHRPCTKNQGVHSFERPGATDLMNCPQMEAYMHGEELRCSVCGYVAIAHFHHPAGFPVGTITLGYLPGGTAT